MNVVRKEDRQRHSNRRTAHHNKFPHELHDRNCSLVIRSCEMSVTMSAFCIPEWEKRACEGRECNTEIQCMGKRDMKGRSSWSSGLFLSLFALLAWDFALISPRCTDVIRWLLLPVSASDASAHVLATAGHVLFFSPPSSSFCIQRTKGTGFSWPVHATTSRSCGHHLIPCDWLFKL